MFQLRNQLAACVAASALMLAVTTPLHAQDVAQEDDALETVVIKGKREGAVLNAPEVLTNHIDNQAIAHRQVEDVRDIGRLDPTINYNSRTQGFVIRGLADNRILTTIDGIRIPWLQDPARGTIGGVSTFDFNALSSLDVVRGSDSSLYGSGALGGVVALRTLEPEDLLTDDKNWASVTKGSYDSVDKSWRVDQAFALRAGSTTMLLQGGYAKGHERKNHGTIGGYGATRTKAEDRDFDQNNLMFKAYHTVDNTHRFGVMVERFERNREGRDFLAAATFVRGTKWDETQRQRERVSLSYDFSGAGILDEAHAVLYWQKQQLIDVTNSVRIPTTSAPGAYMRRSSMDDESYGLLAFGGKAIELGNVDHHLRFAADLRFGQSQQYSAGRDNCPPPPWTGANANCAFLHTNQADSPSVDSTVFGVTLEDEIAFFDNRLRVTPGVRFDYFKHSPQRTAAYERNAGFSGVYPDSRDDTRLSPKLRVEMDTAHNWTLYAQYAQGFRAPSVPELYQLYMNPGSYYVRGNPGLKPETSHGLDIGAQFGNDDFGGSVSFFANRYKNFIDVHDLGGGGGFRFFRQEYINRAKVNISGVEAQMHWQLHHNWRLNGALAYAEGKDIIRDEYLNSIPAFKAVASLEYRQENWGGDVTLTGVAKRANVMTGSHELAKTPGYGLVDVSAWWQPMEKGPRLQAGVYNLFDKKYFDAVSLPTALPQTGQDYAFYSEPGRSFKFSIVQKF